MTCRGRKFGREDWPLLGIFALLLAASLAPAWEREPLAVFHERRARLLRDSGGDGIVVMFGFSEGALGVATTPFRQNENFYYLTGWNEPDAVMLLVPKPDTGGGRNAAPEIEKEILYIPARDPREEKWTGPKVAPEDLDAAARTGFPTVKPTGLFASDLQEALKTFTKIYTPVTTQPESGEEYFQREVLAKLKKLAPLASFVDLQGPVRRQRMVKSPGEIELIRKATEASIEAHLAAMKAVRPGVWEYQVAALMKYEFERRGCEWPAYPPIVGSGFYSTVLHYGQNSNQMQTGDLVVMDVGGMYGGYATDITRTLPVSGRFTPRQREIYEIVLGAQEAALAAANPGIRLGRGGAQGLHQIAYEYINTHGKDSKGKPLGVYFIHGLSHSVGLNVHDPFDNDQPLQPGMVITVEPGIYIPEEKLGVRIEDIIVITEDGHEVLTRRLPKTSEAVETAMANR